MALSSTKTSTSKVEPKSTHVSDSAIQPFLQPNFDPAEYLNSTLPTLSISTTGTRGKAVPLSDLSSQLQTLLSQLNAQTSRLSNTLTQLTDEIIRSGSRLAYEVEVLRGETLGLTDSFENDLKKDIETFVLPSSNTDVHNGDPAAPEDENTTTTPSQPPNDPDFLTHLRDLTTVRTRLDSVIKTFGSAMQWPLAPSELSLASSFISVSAPEPGDDNDSRSREEKGKAYTEKLRTEINDLLAAGVEGVEAANARVEELRELAEVWKGTAEEKARMRLVDALQKSVDEKVRTLEKASADGGRKPGVSPARGYDYRYGGSSSTEIPKAANEGGCGYGFLQNLKNLRNDMYLD
ncbi:hypothetical protein M409DRAFT_51833 [Zasmidium cellare ATCC 36951]|uniref:Uncharacterized protein n=1 Tax=Zasmidium cellare ATCC 36951 TaxID=1080233 RepID=A0A6A6CXI1_ZASCE|nr:uncharacterized protein M409DRAFT_51833 [Zasmidium cellare ATCC 36951]KAF2170066.1 hypothetical protein M409DRAFT_51833 [Zasmidium cellare ATCC 36951]